MKEESRKNVMCEEKPVARFWNLLSQILAIDTEDLKTDLTVFIKDSICRYVLANVVKIWLTNLLKRCRMLDG